jgi:hypothetical protein
MTRILIVALALLGAACTAEVEVQTNPVNLSIPVTSVGVRGYAEIGLLIPPEARGDITVVSLLGTANAVNPSSGTTLRFALYANTEGTAPPGEMTPFLFTEGPTEPPYFARATEVVPEQTFAPGTTTPITIQSPNLVPIITNPEGRVWLTVSNRVTSLGLGDVLPLELQINQLSFNIVVTKSFEEVSGGTDALGL